MALGWRRQKGSPHQARTSPSSVASKAKTRIASARITAAAGRGRTVATFIADLSSQAAVRRLAAEVLDRYPKLDVLVNNAGAMYATRQLTKDGIELTWAINHLAPFLLSKLLLRRLKESAPARIITTASRFKCRTLVSGLWPLLRNQAGQPPVHD
jgi:NAD(P)-dependent dehydrogenase (short-subunit alcohol dehydrogenase family)